MIRFLGTAQQEDKSLLYYAHIKDGHISLKVVKSHDGFQFEDTAQDVVFTSEKGQEISNYNIENFKVSQEGNLYFLTYNIVDKPRLLGAISSDLVNWEATGPVDHIKESGAVVPNYRYRQSYIMYFGEKSTKLAYSAYLYNWMTFKEPLLKARKKSFDDSDIEVGNAFIKDGQILLTYYVTKKKDDDVLYSVGAAIFSEEDPTELLWRSDEPIWEFPKDFVFDRMQPLGAVMLHGELILYWLIDGVDVLAVSCPIPRHNLPYKKDFTAMFKKAENNPIIAPRETHPWESRATFNSAAIYEDGKVHFIYRALGEKDLSVLGYATSTDGIHIDERSDDPIYIPREPFETPGQQIFKTFADHFASGGGYGGVEDPRITKVDNTIYMTYVAFDGANPPRVALTSIPFDDFLNRRWDKWASPKLISAPGMVNKNAVIFPEKIRGKYVVYHRVYPNVLIDYVDDLEFEDKYLQGHHFIPPRKTHWDSKKIGAGAPPIKTEDGWLFVYQSVGYQDPHKYKIGAMLLDHDNPAKVLFRTTSPIVEPNEWYENEGFKAGVAYPCGAVVVNDNLHVYYGGADSVVCAASAHLPTFLKEMKEDRVPKLHRVRSALFN